MHLSTRPLFYHNVSYIFLIYISRFVRSSWSVHLSLPSSILIFLFARFSLVFILGPLFGASFHPLSLLIHCFSPCSKRLFLVIGGDAIYQVLVLAVVVKWVEQEQNKNRETEEGRIKTVESKIVLVQLSFLLPLSLQFAPFTLSSCS